MIWWVESLSPESKTLVLSTLLQSLPSYQVTEWSHRKTGRLWRWLSEVQILTRPLTLWQLMGICQPLWAPIPIRANITSEGPMRIHGAYKDPYTQQVLNNDNEQMTPCPDVGIANSFCHCHFCVSMDSTDLSLEVPCHADTGYTLNAPYCALFLDLITYMSSLTSKLLHIFHIMFHVPLCQKIENHPLYPRASTQ